jgi:hypothetical protein
MVVGIINVPLDCVGFAFGGLVVRVCLGGTSCPPGCLTDHFLLDDSPVVEYRGLTWSWHRLVMSFGFGPFCACLFG